MSIILFGSTGMLGNYVLNILKNDFNVICIKRSDFNIENENWNILDELLKNYITTNNDVIINCAGVIPQKHNFEEFRKYIRINLLKVPDDTESTDKPNIIQVAKAQQKVKQFLKSNDPRVLVM